MAIVQYIPSKKTIVKGPFLSQDALIMALILPIWLMQALVAAVVAALTRRLAVVHGLLAAFGTAVVAFGGLLGFFAIQDGRLTCPAWIFILLFLLIANGGVLPAMLAAWLAARLRAFGRARHAGTEWVFTPVPSLPADLPRWHWGAVCLTWLWALGHHTYGVVLGWVPLLALSLAVGIWGMPYQIPSIFGWFLPFVVLSLVFPWLVPWLVLSLAVGIWGIDP
jgi:hypothetical protein